MLFFDAFLSVFLQILNQTISQTVVAYEVVRNSVQTFSKPTVERETAVS
jgi:hypothetical protein